jgi:uncharacterized glyoxalase superfamily protein PhnB
MTQTAIPMLAYRDGVAAMDWLVRAFGFVEKTRWLDDAGRLSHGELLAGESLLMLATPTPDYEGPTLHRQHCKAADKWLQVPWVVNGVMVYVDDLAAHRRIAERHGAHMLGGIETGPPGDRYRAEDLEGQRWMFMQRPASGSAA